MFTRDWNGRTSPQIQTFHELKDARGGIRVEIETIKTIILDVLGFFKPNGDIVTVEYFSRFVEGCKRCEIYDALESLVEEKTVSKETGGFLEHYPGYRISVRMR